MPKANVDKKLDKCIQYIIGLKDEDCIFKRGDIIADDSKEDVRLVLSVINGICYFMRLKTMSFNDIFGNVHYSYKGDRGNQPIDVCIKYFSVIDI